jgi:AcrR family transcriptional regulator
MTLRERNRHEQRARILAAARELFAGRGFEQVTMREVALQAGVARATVFNHFESKYALVESITEDVLAYYRAMLERALANEEASTPALARGLLDHMGWGIEQFLPFYRGVFRELVKIQVGLDEGGAAARQRDTALERLRRLMARGQARGDITDALPVADLACAFDSLANGTIVHWLYEDTSGSLRERMRRAAEVFLGAMALGVARDEPLPDLMPDVDAIPESLRNAAPEKEAQ